MKWMERNWVKECDGCEVGSADDGLLRSAGTKAGRSYGLRPPVLNEEICCWIYTINPSKHHLLMAMRVQSGTFAMCMAMAPPERRECVPTSSWSNLSLDAPTRLHSTLRRVITMEALTERRP